jgi:uncharacterized protein YegL
MSDRRDQVVIVADVSPSMETRDGGSREGKTRFQLLKDALRQLPAEIKIVTFSGTVREVKSHAEVNFIDDFGGTALHLGIEAALKYKPVRTVIISDGEPDSEDLAKAAVDKITGIVDVVFCGDPKNTHAKAFLESLAKLAAGGFYETGDQVDVMKQLPAVIAGLLGTGSAP